MSKPNIFYRMFVPNNEPRVINFTELKIEQIVDNNKALESERTALYDRLREIAKEQSENHRRIESLRKVFRGSK